MFVDLDDNITRFVVQEYLNKIVDADSSAEKSYDLHKLIHTLDVVKMARRLIELSDNSLSSDVKTHILNGAVLHDVARCYEYKDGKKLKGFDHGSAGAQIIQKQFPNLTIEQGATQWHNKLPSQNDPQELQPVLDYVRDADMLGNIHYQVHHMDLFLGHIRASFPKEDDQPFVSDDIIACAIDRQIRPYGPNRKHTLLDMFLNQLLWIFTLKTRMAFQLAKSENLFVRYRDIIVHEVVPILNISAADQKAIAQKILTVFSNSLFEGEFQKHGV